MRRFFVLSALLVVMSPAAFAAHNSPVGTWEVAAVEHDHGTMYLTFDDAGTLSGYGLTDKSFNFFLVAGEWEMDGHGHLSGSFTEDIAPEEADEETTASLTFAGNVLKGNLQLDVDGDLGHSMLFGIRATMVSDVSGTWEGIWNLGHAVDHANVMLTSIEDFPGAFVIGGTGMNHSHQFDISGTLVEDSQGRITAYLQLTSTDEEENEVEEDIHLFGHLKPKHARIDLDGVSESGEALFGKIVSHDFATDAAITF